MHEIARRAPGRPRQTESRALVARLVVTAGELFIKQGYAGTSVDQIAREAGVDKQTVYRRFGSKNDLFLAVCEREFQLQFGEREPNNPVIKTGGIEEVRRFCRIATLALLAPRSVQICRIWYSEAYRYPGLGDLLREHAAKQVLTPLARYIAAAQANNEAKDGDPDMLAQQVLTACMAKQFLHALLGSTDMNDLTAREAWFDQSWLSASRILCGAN